jgi:hypothetical protein
MEFGTNYETQSNSLYVEVVLETELPGPFYSDRY